MIIIGDKKFIEAKFENEAEIEDVVQINYEHFFGYSSIMIPKKRIETFDGSGTIPDGFAIDIDSRTWFIVEAELGCHSVWNHIAPQITKQIIASRKPETRSLLIEVVIQMANDENIKDKFKENNIEDINIRKVLEEILKKQPIIGIPIDSVSEDLKGWAETLKNTVRLWTIEKYIEFGNDKNTAYIIPEEFKPSIEFIASSDLSPKDSDEAYSIRTYNVDIYDLLQKNLLQANSRLSLKYTPRGGTPQTFEGTILADGSITVFGQKYTSPSYAAMACIQHAGSTRETVNGWTSWKTADGKLLSQIREEYLKLPPEENSDQTDE